MANAPAGQGPCEGVGGIWHDDGSFENGYSGSAGVVDSFENVDLFSPLSPNYDYTRYGVGLVTLGGTDLDFEIVFFDGTGGIVGAELAAVSVSAANIPGGLPCGWYEYDFTGVSGLPTGADGDVFIGVRYNPTLFPSRFTCSDETVTTPLWTGFTNFNTGTGWESTGFVFGD